MYIEYRVHDAGSSFSVCMNKEVSVESSRFSYSETISTSLVRTLFKC